MACLLSPGRSAAKDLTEPNKPERAPLQLGPAHCHQLSLKEQLSWECYRPGRSMGGDGGSSAWKGAGKPPGGGGSYPRAWLQWGKAVPKQWLTALQVYKEGTTGIL